MFNYAFIVNSEGLTPEDYSWSYKNDEMKLEFLATSGMEMTKKYAKKLADKGVKYIDLCGDFDADKADEAAKATDNKIEVCYAKYSDSETKKMDKLTDLGEYGIIIMAYGLEPGSTKTKRLVGSEFVTTIVLVDSEDAAKAAAKGLVDGGINFIELCSFFDENKANDIIDSIKGAVPVGYCG